MLSWQLQGAEIVLSRLHALADLRGLDGDLEAGADTIVAEAQQEPPERPGQRYVRSHRLSRAWKRRDAKRDGAGLLLDVTNDTPYALFVQGEEQAEVHQGRWKRIRTIAEAQRGPIRARTQRWALRVWRGG